VAGFVIGSTARGTAGPRSDVDIAVLLTAAAARFHRTAAQEARLLADLMSSLGTRDVDLVLLNEAPPFLSHRVLRNGGLLRGTDERALADFRFRPLRTYLGTKPPRGARTVALRDRLVRDAFAEPG
jgi:predicted nucleotidyltransferase